MEYFKMETYILILFSLCITSSLSFTADLASAHDTDRLARVESLLETVISKNQELEKRVEQLEIQLKGQKTVNDELLNRISKFESIQNNNAKADSLENVTLNVTCDRNSGIQNRSNHDHLHTEKQKNPQIKRNKTRANKRLLDSMSSTPSVLINDKPVAFTAYLSKDVTGLGTGQVIMYDRVITNVGGGYHTSHGNFIAPTDGVYVFTLMAMARPGHYEHLDFIKDGAAVGEIYVGTQSNDNYQSTCGIITLSLSKGNEVWVRTPLASWHGTGSLHGGFVTSFSGWLLSE